MKIINLKNITPERLFKSKDSIRKLLKKKGYFVTDFSENSFNGILMLSDTKGIKINYINFAGDYPNTREVLDVTYKKSIKTFTIAKS